jgi:hypothetical protein
MTFLLDYILLRDAEAFKIAVRANVKSSTT